MYKTIPNRQFLGKTGNFESKEEKVFYQRMLKAYHNGRSEFYFGFDVNGYPKTYEVLQTPKQSEYSGMRGNAIANKSQYPIYYVAFNRRKGKNMTK